MSQAAWPRCFGYHLHRPPSGERKARLPEREQKYRRARALKAWMEKHRFEDQPISFSVLGELTGLASSTVTGLLAEYGTYGSDIGTARTETVHALIRGLQKVDPELTPAALVEMFEIKSSRYQKRWLTFDSTAPTPGHNTLGSRIHLLVPLVGHVFAPSGWWVSYFPDEPGEPGLWRRNNVHWVLPAGATLPEGQHLGKFLSVGPH